MVLEDNINQKGGVVMMNKFFDRLGLPKESAVGKKLTLMGRLTFDWLWTDDPKFDEIDWALRTKERR